MQGSIFIVVHSHGIGFISGPKGKQVFFECSALDDSDRSNFKAGTEVRFELDGPPGTPATNIARVARRAVPLLLSTPAQ